MINMDVNSKKSLWRLGKENNKAYLNLNLKKGTSMKTLFFGMLLAGLLILPIAIIVFQFVELYWYHRPNTMYLFLGIAFALLMFANGLSNYITIRATQLCIKDMDNLQEIDEYAIFYFQLTNIGFGLFIGTLLIVFGVSAL